MYDSVYIEMGDGYDAAAQGPKIAQRPPGQFCFSQTSTLKCLIRLEHFSGYAPFPFSIQHFDINQSVISKWIN